MLDLVDAIDLHSHYNHGSPYDQIIEHPMARCEIDYLMEEYNSSHIRCGVYSSFASVLEPKSIVDENNHLYEISQKHERVYQWVVIDPRRDETFDQADRILTSEKCLGIKIHPGYHGYDIVEYGDKIFSYANEKEAFVLMHPDKIELMPGFADRYPKMKLIIAHLGWVAHVDAIEQAKHKNIFADTSGIASSNNNVIEYTINRVGSEHIFFGTDTYSCAFQRGRIQFARIPEKDKENILRNNALRMFPGKFNF